MYDNTFLEILRTSDSEVAEVLEVISSWMVENLHTINSQCKYLTYSFLYLLLLLNEHRLKPEGGIEDGHSNVIGVCSFVVGCLYSS